MVQETYDYLNQSVYVNKIWVFYYNDVSNKYEFIEEQEIRYEKSKPFVFNTTPLTLETVQNLKIMGSSSELTSLQFKSVIPKNIIYIKSSPINYRLIWSRLPKKTNLHFDKSLGIKNGEYVLPGLIFDYSENSTKIYAYKQKKIKSKLEIELFHCPLFNISASGELCWGNVKNKTLDFNSFEELIKKVENLFFSGTFTHSSHQDNIQGTTLNEYWNNPNAVNSFNNDVLKKYGKTIRNIL